MPDLAKAVDLWLRLRPDPADQAQGLVWRGRLHGYQNDYPKAVADLRKAVELDPDSLDARLRLAAVIAQESPQKAADQLEALRQRHPDNIQLLFSLATVRRVLGQLEEAASILDGILAGRPDDLSTLLERAQVALDLRQPQPAETWLRRALTQLPNEPDIHLALSRCLSLLGKETEAKQHHERHLQINTERNRQQDQAAPPSR